MSEHGDMQKAAAFNRDLVNLQSMRDPKGHENIRTYMLTGVAGLEDYKKPDSTARLQDSETNSNNKPALPNIKTRSIVVQN